MVVCFVCFVLFVLFWCNTLSEFGLFKKTRIGASLGLRMKFKTLFMSDHDLLIFFNMSNQFLAPGGLNAECVQVSVM